MAENYFVFGEEEYLVRQKITELCARHADQDKWAIENITDCSSLQDRLFNLGMFSERRVFLVDYAILTGEKQGFVHELIAAHDNILIIYSLAKPDKRTHLFKDISRSSKLIEVISLRGAELLDWVTQRAKALGAAKIDRKTANTLIFLAGTNMFILENELKKLIIYDPEVTEESVYKLAVRDDQVSIFDLVDNVVQGSLDSALAKVDSMLRGGTAVPYILHMLARQYRMLFKMLFYRQKGYGNTEIQKIMPLHPFAFQKLSEQASSISGKECANSLHEILKTDYTYKTGLNQGMALLQMLLVKLAKK